MDFEGKDTDKCNLRFLFVFFWEEIPRTRRQLHLAFDEMHQVWFEKVFMVLEMKMMCFQG